MSNATPFGDADFDDLLSRHGAEPARWPAETIQQAQALLGDSARAQALLAEARRLERALDAIPTLPLPPGLRTRIVANATPQDAWLRWLATKPWRPASLACVPLLLGIAVGVGSGDDTGDLEDSVLAAFSTSGFADEAPAEAPAADAEP